MESDLKFKITRLHRIEGNSSVRAFVDVALNECLLLKGLRVVEGRKGLFVSMPREKGKDNRWYETIHPMSKQVKESISTTVLSAYHNNQY
jgi:stage V sporulation protein G